MCQNSARHMRTGWEGKLIRRKTWTQKFEWIKAQYLLQCNQAYSKIQKGTESEETLWGYPSWWGGLYTVSDETRWDSYMERQVGMTNLISDFTSLPSSFNISTGELPKKTLWTVEKEDFLERANTAELNLSAQALPIFNPVYSNDFYKE